MPKKCIICGGEAAFQIKGSSEYYCMLCARENFADLDMLEKVQQQTLKLKDALEKE
jgi:hypothetical protein